MADEYKSVISDKKKEADRLMNDEQMKACNVAIHTASVAAGAAGVIPIPVADALPITGAQVTMAIALGNIFEQKLSDSAAKALVSAAATTFVGRTLIKLIPITGWIASAGVAAGVTEAIGWALAVDFAKEYQKDHFKDDTEDNVVSMNDLEDDGTADAEEIIEEETLSDEAENQEKAEAQEDPDDESLSNKFANLFGEEDE